MLIWGGIALFEAASTAYDVYQAGKTLSDPNATTGDKAWASGGAIVGGLGLPGPGALYAGTARAALRIERHHLLPQAFKKQFERAGLDIEQFTKELPVDVHRLKPNGLHTGPNNWNKQWKEFFRENENPTQQQILGHLEKMMRASGLQR